MVGLRVDFCILKSNEKYEKTKQSNGKVKYKIIKYNF